MKVLAWCHMKVPEVPQYDVTLSNMTFLSYSFFFKTSHEDYKKHIKVWASFQIFK